MIVKELIFELQKMPQDLQVIIQKDSEGNNYSPLNSVDSDCIYSPDTADSGEVHSTIWTWEEAMFESEEEWEVFKKTSLRCCVLTPRE
jgi:hypothetical protein